eukprot:s3742_g1.t1
MLILSVFLLPLVAAEPACLLQKTNQPTQISALAKQAQGEYAGTGSCVPRFPETHVASDLASCISQCTSAATGFSLQGTVCLCCAGFSLSSSSSVSLYARSIPSWQFLAVRKECPTFHTLGTTKFIASGDINECAQYCEGLNAGVMQYFSRFFAGDCICCNGGLRTAASSNADANLYWGYTSKITIPGPGGVPVPLGWEYAGTGTCDPISATFNGEANDIAACASLCLDRKPKTTGIRFDGTACTCCRGLILSSSSTVPLYAKALPPLWNFLGVGKSCPTAQILSSGIVSDIYNCARTCETNNAGEMVYSPINDFVATCTCCSGALISGGTSLALANGALISRGASSDFGYTTSPVPVATPGVEGDPHITALDGSHYLLLSQGTFSLWHLHGLLAEFQSEDGTQDGSKKVPVDWEVYTHYSGQQSFTKGLLLVDRSAGVQRQILEITSQDCQWRARSGAEWRMVSKPGMISVADGQDYVTGFNVTKTNGKKDHATHASHSSGSHFNFNQVHFSMNTKDGATDVAVLTVSCRPKRNLDLNLVMKRRSDQRFVEGELASRKTLATLQTSDSEFGIKDKWQDIGGSDHAAAYLRQMDEDSSSKTSLLQICNAEDKVQAKITCSKYLDSLSHLDPSGFVLNDCVYDICHGAGEVAAELAAELLKSTNV